MKMKICKDCGSEVSKSAKTCPKCGKNLKNNVMGIVIAIIILIIIGVACGLSSTTDKTNTSSSDSGISIFQNNEKATLEKFNKIETGMTYQQVVDIMGEEGTLSTESSYGSQSMKVYYWYSSNGISNATISFMNGKVNAKSQIGLQ